jgi:glycosyltransferase involved in cell wall biosynthesis
MYSSIKEKNMKVGLVIPCFNESKRLHLNSFKSHSDLTLLFVDDGSEDNTFDFINSWSLPNAKVIRLLKNVGKAEATRIGMISMIDFYPELDWVGYWDADLSTPLEEVENSIKYANMFFSDAQSIWCSRLLRLGSDIRRSPLRHILGRIFMTIVGYFFHETVYDSQCGAKLFKRSVVQTIFVEPFISRWIFDVEILQRAKIKHIKTIEYPLLKWEDVPGSKVKLTRTAVRVIWDLYQIKRKYRQ